MGTVISIDPGSVHTGWCIWRDGRYSISGVWHRQQSRSKKTKLPGWHSQLTLYFIDFFNRHHCDMLVIERPYPGPNSKALLECYATIITCLKQARIMMTACGDDIRYDTDVDNLVYDVSPKAWTSKYPKEKQDRLKKAVELTAKDGIVSEDEACAVLLGDWYRGRSSVG